MKNNTALTPEEYQKIIEEKDRLLEEKDALIEELRAEMRMLLDEKEDMIENFKVSTGFLIEKIKDLESQRVGYRPQTANILARPSKGFQKIIIGIENENKIGGFQRKGGSVIKTNVELQAEWEREIPEDPGAEEEKADKKKCHNCQKMVPMEDYETHLILCFRCFKMGWFF